MLHELQLWRDHLPPGPALDIGAGDGQVSLWLASQGRRVDAIEPGRAAADALDQRFSGQPIKLHRQDVLDWPIPEGHYAVIVASAVLHFIEHASLQPLARSIERGLTPGGLLFAAVFTTDDPAAGASPAAPEAIVHTFFPPGGLRELFPELAVLHYEESRRSSPDSRHAFRSGATLVARKPPDPGQAIGL